MQTTVIQSRDWKFRSAFLGDSRNLAMCLTSVIEDASLEKEVEKSPLLWGENTVRLYASDNPESPSEESLRFFLAMSKVSTRSGSDIENLRNFWSNWIDENPSGAMVNELPVEKSDTVADVVSESIAPEAAVIEEPEVSQTKVNWTIDAVQIGQDVWQLRQRTELGKKSIRSRVYETLEVIRAQRGLLSVEDFSKVLRENKSTYGNFKAEHTYLNQERAEKWALNLGISVRELLGYPALDNASGQMSLPVEEPETVILEEPETVIPEEPEAVIAEEPEAALEITVDMPESIVGQSDESQDKLDLLDCIKRNEIDSEVVHELMELFLKGKTINFKAVMMKVSRLSLREVAGNVSVLCEHPIWKQVKDMSLVDFVAAFKEE